MIFLPLLLVLSAGAQTLFDENVLVPAGQWQAITLRLRQRTGEIQCDFSVRQGGSGVRVVLLSGDEFARLRTGRRFSVLAGTGYVRRGGFAYRTEALADYVVALDNGLEGRGPAEVHLKIGVDFDRVTARTLSPPRRIAVIASALTIFALILALSWVKLGAALKGRWGRPTGPL